MESFRELSKNLGKCKKLSKKIIDFAIPIMKDIDEKNDELTEELLVYFPKITKQKLFAIMKKTILELIYDSENILKEIDGFSNILMEDGGDNVYMYENNYSFLVGVWSGDVYDQEKNMSLIELIKDLKKTKKIVEDQENFLIHIKTIIEK